MLSKDSGDGLVRLASKNRMRKNAVLATRFVEFSFETRAVVAENRVSSRLLR